MAHQCSPHGCENLMPTYQFRALLAHELDDGAVIGAGVGGAGGRAAEGDGYLVVTQDWWACDAANVLCRGQMGKKNTYPGHRE